MLETITIHKFTGHYNWLIISNSRELNNIYSSIANFLYSNDVIGHNNLSVFYVQKTLLITLITLFRELIYLFNMYFYVNRSNKCTVDICP